MPCNGAALHPGRAVAGTRVPVAISSASGSGSTHAGQTWAGAIEALVPLGIKADQIVAADPPRSKFEGGRTASSRSLDGRMGSRSARV